MCVCACMHWSGTVYLCVCIYVSICACVWKYVCVYTCLEMLCVYVCLQMCMSVLKCGGGGGGGGGVSPHPIRTSSSFQPTCALHLRMDADTALGYTSIASQDSAVGLLIAQGTSPVLRLLILMTFETLQPFIYKDQRLWNNSVQGGEPGRLLF